MPSKDGTETENGAEKVPYEKNAAFRKYRDGRAAKLLSEIPWAEAKQSAVSVRAALRKYRGERKPKCGSEREFTAAKENRCADSPGNRRTFYGFRDAIKRHDGKQGSRFLRFFVKIY